MGDGDVFDLDGIDDDDDLDLSAVEDLSLSFLSLEDFLESFLDGLLEELLLFFDLLLLVFAAGEDLLLLLLLLFLELDFLLLDFLSVSSFCVELLDFFFSLSATPLLPVEVLCFSFRSVLLVLLVADLPDLLSLSLRLLFLDDLLSFFLSCPVPSLTSLMLAFDLLPLPLLLILPDMTTPPEPKKTVFFLALDCGYYNNYY